MQKGTRIFQKKKGFKILPTCRYIPKTVNLSNGSKKKLYFSTIILLTKKKEIGSKIYLQYLNQDFLLRNHKG
jgi:hypothetical protein